MDNSTGGMSQTIKGFYDPAPVAGKITHIVGSGQANKPERLLVPGSTVINPFQSLQGDSWDNVTLPTAAITGDSLTTSVDHAGFGSFDCLTWSAIVYRTQVNDTDGDGLLDKWESSHEHALRSERQRAAEHARHGCERRGTRTSSSRSAT